MSGVGTAFRPLRRPSLIQRLGLRPRQHESDAKSYCARLYYSKSGTNSWEVHFAIMCNLELHISAVDTSYTNAAAKAGPSQVVMFERDEITLDIAAEGVVLENGWTITPYTHTGISKDQVDHFVPGSQVPSCQLYVEWTGQQEQPPELLHRVKLLGAKEPQNIFLIRLPSLPASPPPLLLQVETSPMELGVAGGNRMQLEGSLGSKYAGLKSGPELSDLMTEIASKVPAKWKEISIQLGLTLSDQKHFMEVTLGDPKQCFTFVFTVWKNRATRPYTWSTMIEVLESPAVDEMRLAQELRRKLQSEHGFSQGGQQLPMSITSASGTIQPGLGSKYAGLESEPELSDLMTEVASKVSAKWKEISIQLGLTLNDLESFTDATGDNAMKCFPLVFNAWKSRATRPYTWSTVIEVLNAPAVAEVRLAQELRTKLQSVGGFSQGGQQLPMSITSASGPIQPGLGSKYAVLDSEPELSDLMNEVASKVSAKWKEISIQLGLTLNDLASFTDATDDNPMNCFPLVFNAWKSRATRPYTWSTVIEVLNAPAVAEVRLAQELRTKLQSVGGFSQGGQQLPMSITSASGPIQPGLGSKYAGLESEPELSDLMNEVASKVSAKWKEISIQLGLTLNDLASFTDATDDNPMNCFPSVFNAWKSRATRPYTWSTVIEVLNAPAVAEVRLAQELRTKLQSVGGFSQGGQQLPMSITSASGPIQPGLGSKYAGLESEPELSDLMNEVASKVSAKWKEISIQLGLTLNDLASFTDATDDNPMNCFPLVFNAWKSRATRPYTWSTVIEVLNAPAVAEVRLAQELRTKLQSVGALENQPHYEAYQHALKEGVEISLKYVKFLFFGPPRTGKTSMRRRLVGEIQNLVKEPVQTSTGTSEHHDVIVKLVEEKISDKITASTTVITKSKWSAVKALFSKEKSIHETELDEELRLLYHFIYEVAHPIVERSPVPEEKAQNEGIKEPSPATQVKMKTDVESPILIKPPETVGFSCDADNVNSDVSVLHKVSSDRGPRYGLDAKETEEIEKAFEAFDKVLHTPQQELVKVLLDGTVLVNMVDTGGQPAFLEMLPALTISPALYLIFFRLNQDLKKRYQVQFVSEAHKEIQLGESSYTVEEVIFQALSSIACFSCAVPKQANMPNPSHAAMLIGTHKDQLGSDPETVATEIKAKDDALRKSLTSDILKSDNNFLRYASNDHLIFAVDNMTGDEAELEDIRKRLENIIKQEFDDWPIPASWLMFSIFLRRMGKRIMSLSQCYEIGNRLKVKNTNEALWFLHHCVGVLMHFPEIKEIKDIVICDPQVVFDSVTNLILNSFMFKKVRKQACDKFKETGQFSFKDILKIEKNSKSDSLSLPKLVKLLEYHNIIAPIRPGGPLPSGSPPLSPGLNPQSYQEENMVYFMPAVLRHANEEELHIKQSSTDPAPLIIHFKCGFVPVGVFCAMIASLVSQLDTLRWTLLDPSYSHTLCKNKIVFRISGAYDLTLISKPKWYEIYIVRISTKVQPLENMCRHVLETVCDTLDHVISKMRYKQFSTSSPSDPTLYELGFKCPEHPNDDHLMTNVPMSGVEVPSQSAKSLWLNHHERKSVMICQGRSIEGGKAIDLRDRRFSWSFAAQSLVWFGEITKAPSLLPDSVPGGGIERTPSTVPNIEDLMDTLYHPVADKWEQIGIYLLLPMTTLKAITAEHQHDPHMCLLEMLEVWLKRVDPPPTWSAIIRAVEYLGERQLGRELREKYFFEINIEKTPSKSHVLSGGETKRIPNKPQLKDLMDALYHKVADKWRTIGLYLEIPKGKLAGIAEKCRDDLYSCLVEVLETWLEQLHPPPTWTAIIEAVEFLGEEQLGKELREKYSATKQRTEEIAVKGSDYNPAVVPVLSLLQLYHLFVNLRTKALDAAMQLNVKDFQDFLAGLPVFTTVEKHKFFHRRTLYSFTTMTKLFHYLDDFWDYINCDLLQQVVMKIGDSELSDAMEEYCTKLMQMKRETTVQRFAFQVCNQRQLQVVRSEEFFTEVLIRLHARSNEYTLHDAERLRQSFLSTYSLTSYSVAFCNVFEGTIVIKLWLKSECSPVTIQCEKLSDFVIRNHVLQILVDGIPIQFSEVTKIEVNPSPSSPSQGTNPLSSSATRTAQQPTLSQLICFKTRADSINVLEQIGSHYREFGVLLLEDTAGAVTEAIVTKHKCDAKAINWEILRNWLEGKGKKPVEWSTLVKVLNDIRLSELANEMEQTLQI